MGFSEELKASLKPVYTERLIEEFYNPALSEATLYQRVSGYFSSKGVDLYIDGIEELAKNGGIAQFIISKEISREDYDKIIAGYNLLEELKTLRLSEQNERLSSQVQSSLGNLAFMIAMGRAKVKIALTTKGLFHDKFGIISSGKEKIFFTGSANETKGGMEVNYESLSVDFSWENSRSINERIEINESRFDRLWNDDEDGVTVVEASELAYEQIAKFQKEELIKSDISLNEIESTEPTLDGIISFVHSGGRLLRRDLSNEHLTSTDRKLKQGSDLTIYFEQDNSTLRQGITYLDLERIIKVTTDRAQRKNIEVFISDSVKNYIRMNRYAIQQYKILGTTYKGALEGFPDTQVNSFIEFSQIVQSQVTRPLLDLHLRAAFYQYEMSRAANFSVPGSGKTAMILGVFAYLNSNQSPKSERIDRILVVSPINAFSSWKYEFEQVFGNKKGLAVITSQDSTDFTSMLNLKWKVSNLILVNYESLQKYQSLIESNMDSTTMLVFDEVHRIKNPVGKRALVALDISKKAKFKYVLSGTPIPNTYEDIYNFLNILYGNEYNSFFGWSLSTLKKPKIREINQINRSLLPFFWRTNKKDLSVPESDPDIIKSVPASEEQLRLAEAIYYNEKSSLAKLIRLMQASTNPALLSHKIEYNEVMSYEDDSDLSSISEKEFNDLLGEGVDSDQVQNYDNFNFDTMISPKFEKGIELVTELVKSGKKVLVWGLFVDTLKKIEASLQKNGISVNLVYGGTDKLLRDNLISEFKFGSVQVLVSNPQTLGEAISLHHTVHDAVYFEYNFNLTFMLQSRDRIHRVGLEENQYTRYYYLQTEDEIWSSYRPGFIDEKIYKLLLDKEQIMYEALDSDNLAIEYDKDEIIAAIDIIEKERMRIKI